MKSIESYIRNLQQKNIALSNELKSMKADIVDSGAIASTKGDGDYGFFSASQMPSGQYTSDTI